MNLPDQINEFGPLRLHWEGTREKYIQQIKPMLTNLRANSTYLVTKIQQHSQNSYLDLLMSDTINKNEKKRNFEITSFGYPSISIIRTKIENNEALKGLLLKNEKHAYTLICGLNKWSLCQMNLSDENGVFRCGQFYTEMKSDILNIVTECESKQDLNNLVKDMVMFIPLNSTQTEDSHLYTIITKDWKQ